MTITVEGHEFPLDRWYEPREHLWLLLLTAETDPLVAVGVDALGQELLGEVVYVQLVEPGLAVSRGDALGSLEAEKMVRPVLAPVSGTVVEVNAGLLASPRLLNVAPYGAGWVLRLRASRWAGERQDLLHGEAAVAAWARAEVEASQKAT